MKKTGIVILDSWWYKEALRIVMANGGTENDKEAIFEEYKKLCNAWKEVDPKQVESYPKVMGFIQGEKKKAVKKVKKVVKKKKKK